MTAPHPGSPASAGFALTGVEEGRHNISPGREEAVTKLLLRLLEWDKVRGAAIQSAAKRRLCSEQGGKPRQWEIVASSRSGESSSRAREARGKREKIERVPSAWIIHEISRFEGARLQPCRKAAVIMLALATEGLRS